MKTLKVFYNERQTAKDANSFSPSAGKPALAVESWQSLGLPIEIVGFKPATRAQISQVHSKAYVDGVLDLKKPNGFGNTNPGVAKALPWVCGSVVAAALYAAENREIVASPTSGAHHACYNRGGGFCTFNSLVLAAHEVLKSGLVRKVGLWDVDNHAGNGSKDIIDKLDLNIVHWSLGYSNVTKENAEDWLKRLPKFLIKKFNGCDLIIANLGADPHVDDPLGGRLTTDQMRRRDQILFDYCVKYGKGCSWQLAGGYQQSIRNVLDIHDNTFVAWAKATGIKNEN